MQLSCIFIIIFLYFFLFNHAYFAHGTGTLPVLGDKDIFGVRAKNKNWNVLIMSRGTKAPLKKKKIRAQEHQHTHKNSLFFA